MQVTTPSKKPLQRQIEPAFTTAPIEAPQGLPTAQPIWIRLPKSGQLCPFTGLSRSSMNALILGSNPQVKSVSLKKPYAIRGTRLIHFGSLLEFIERAASAQNTISNSGAGDNQKPKRLPRET